MGKFITFSVSLLPPKESKSNVSKKFREFVSEKCVSSSELITLSLTWWSCKTFSTLSLYDVWCKHALGTFHHPPSWRHGHMPMHGWKSSECRDLVQITQADQIRKACALEVHTANDIIRLKHQSDRCKGLNKSTQHPFENKHSCTHRYILTYFYLCEDVFTQLPTLTLPIPTHPWPLNLTKTQS